MGFVDFSRYRVYTFDEFVRLWCEDCYTEGDELGMWPEYPDPINFSEMVKLVQAHEKKCHPPKAQLNIQYPSSPTPANSIIEALRRQGGYGGSAY